jgi:hypothetical protein
MDLVGADRAIEKAIGDPLEQCADSLLPKVSGTVRLNYTIRRMARVSTYFEAGSPQSALNIMAPIPSHPS